MIAGNKNRWRIWLYGITLSLVALIVIIYISGQVVRNNLARQYSAPGTMITAHDHKLHVHCEGNGPETVFLVAGLNEFSLQWGQLQTLLSRTTKTCSYDRAGLGWSEAAEEKPTIDHSVNDLRKVIQAVSDKRPIIMVGHSYGAILTRIYAQRFPDNIKAIVLLDPANEYMHERIDGYAEVLVAAAAEFRHLARLASFGLIAFSTESIPAGLLQGEAVEQYRAVLASGSFFEAASTETAEMVNNLRAAQNAGAEPAPEVPVVIISRGRPEPIPGLPDASAKSLEQTWSQLQADLAVTMNAKQIIAGKSGHSIQLTQPALVFDTIRPFIIGKKMGPDHSFR